MSLGTRPIYKTQQNNTNKRQVNRTLLPEKLIKKGEKLWSSLEKLGVEFKSLQHKKQAIPLQYKRSNADIETEWTQFDVEEELNQLRRKNGFSD